jgi:hypothetical protein
MVKKALIVGINYYGSSCQLAGCINDAKNMMAALQAQDYTLFRLLTDEPGTAAEYRPTKANMLAGFQWLLAGATPQDRLFFHYSGHGTQTYDYSGDEEDLKDEAMCPVDCQTAGFITDDELRAQLVDPCVSTLVVISDCCHSGTILDLRYNYQQSAQRDVMMRQNPKVKASKANVICLSGCEDAQTSADAGGLNPRTGRYEAQGALTCTLLAILKAYPVITYKKLLQELWTRLRAQRYTQIPQLTCGQWVDLGQTLQL